MSDEISDSQQFVTEAQSAPRQEIDRPLGDPEIAVEILKHRVAELEAAIRRLADQDATLSVQGGNVIVEMDATLTDSEREAVAECVEICGLQAQSAYEGQSEDTAERWARKAATLRGLLERTK